jgi:FMN reductase
MNERSIVVVSAGLSQPSSTRLLGDRLATAAADALREQGLNAVVGVVELRDHAHDLTDNLLTGFAGPELTGVLDRVARADGLIAVTPTFSASYSGLFKLFFDVIEPGTLAGKPVLLAATGGTARHSLALEHAMRPLFAYLQALTVPTGVFAASGDWGSGTSLDGRALADRIRLAGAELGALVAAREPQAPAGPFEQVTPFEALLAGN